MNIAEKLTAVAENVPRVYEAGQLDMEKRFTANWRRTNYSYGFMQNDWSGYTFSRPLVATGSVINAFNGYIGQYLPKNVDFSQANTTSTSGNRIFYGAKNLLEADMMGLGACASYSETFRTCNSLKKITGLRVNEETVFPNAFNGCDSLEDIEIIGTIGTDISFPTSPLTIDCIYNIFLSLKDYSGSGETHTVKLESSLLDSLDDADKVLATSRGWTLA